MWIAMLSTFFVRNITQYNVVCVRYHGIYVMEVHGY